MSWLNSIGQLIQKSNRQEKNEQEVNCYSDFFIILGFR